MYDFELAKYIYWEYSLAVLIVTEVFKAITKGSTRRWVVTITVTHPKWISLIVAVVLAVLDWLIIGNGNAFHLWQFLISFGVAVLGYDYIYKLIREQFKKPAVDNKPPESGG